MTSRRNFLSSLAVVTASIALPNFAANASTITPAIAEVDPVVTQIMGISWCPELAQDLKNVHGIDADEELEHIMFHHLREKLGDRRGTAWKKLVLDPDSYQPRYDVFFRNDGKHGPENNWGLTILSDETTS